MGFDFVNLKSKIQNHHATDNHYRCGNRTRMVDK